MTNASLIRRLESEGKYVRIRVDKAGHVTAGRADSPVRYCSATNSGGRVYVGHVSDVLGLWGLG